MNESYRGRHFPTIALKAYQELLGYLLPKDIGVFGGKLSVHYIFGVSSKSADGDNLIKAFQDVLATVYRFNDKQIYEWRIEKVDVKKGKEYIAFDIKPYHPDHSYTLIK